MIADCQVPSIAYLVENLEHDILIHPFCCIDKGEKVFQRVLRESQITTRNQTCLSKFKFEIFCFEDEDVKN